MPPIPGVVLNWHSLLARHAKHLKSALNKAARTIDAQITGKKNPAHLEAIFARNTPKQPLHPLARIRQQQSRWYSSARSAIRSFSTSSRQARIDKSTYAETRIGTHLHQSAGRAPFASTLRPHLTGGSLGRTAGGYTLGSGRVGGARYFSHGPASQAQVVQNVSQGMRAFLTAGHRAQFDGCSPNSGEKRFRTVSNLQDEASRTMKSVPRATPGSWIEFRVNPTITALTPLDAACIDVSADAAGHLNTEGLIDLLSVDFSRALKDLATVLNDIRRLSSLGDLPITHQGHSIRVHFAGCDADTIERLCHELGVQRGMVVQDPAFDSFVGAEMALLFPYAPSEEDSDLEGLYSVAQPTAPVKSGPLISLEDMLSASVRSDIYSDHSDYSSFSDVVGEDMISSSPSRFESIRSESLLGPDDKYSPLEYQGIEGIYRFIEQCDSARH